MRCSSLVVENRHYFWFCLCWASLFFLNNQLTFFFYFLLRYKWHITGTINSNHFRWVFPTWVASSNTHFYWYCTEYVRETLCSSLELFSCTILSSLVLFPVNSSCFGLLRLVALSPQLRVSPRLFLAPSSSTLAWKLFQGNNLGQL